MSKLLEILGGGLFSVSSILLHWFNLNKNKGGLSGDLECIVEDIRNNNLKNAKKGISSYLHKNPRDAYGIIASALIHFSNNDFENATKDLNEVCLIKPSETMALYALGYSNEVLGNEAKALEFYQDCIKFKKHLSLPLMRMAAIYFKNGRINKAIEQYELLVANNETGVSSHQLLGYLYLAAQKYEKAIDTFNTNIIRDFDNFQDESKMKDDSQMKDDNLYDQVELGDRSESEGMIDDAIAHYEQALRIEPNFLRAVVNLGGCYLKKNELSLAAEQFNMAIDINDEIIDSYVGLAIAQHLSGEKNDATSTLGLASTINVNSARLFSKAFAFYLKHVLDEKQLSIYEYQQQGNEVTIKDVIDAHRTHIEKDINNAYIKYKMGMLMMESENLVEAKYYFKDVLRINPLHYRARTKLALCLYATGYKDEALDTLLGDDGPVKINDGRTLLISKTLELMYQSSILYSNNKKFVNVISEMGLGPKLLQMQYAFDSMGLLNRKAVNWEILKETAKYAIGVK